MTLEDGLLKFVSEDYKQGAGTRYKYDITPKGKEFLKSRRILKRL